MDRKELKKHIPYGYGKIIAEKAGVSERAVSQYLASRNNSVKVEMAILEVIAHLKSEKKRLTEIIK